jgi:hypothetical protein
LVRSWLSWIYREEPFCIERPDRLTCYLVIILIAAEIIVAAVNIVVDLYAGVD